MLEMAVYKNVVIDRSRLFVLPYVHCRIDNQTIQLIEPAVSKKGSPISETKDSARNFAHNVHCSPDNQLDSHLVTPRRILIRLLPGFGEIDLQHILVFCADFHAVAGDRSTEQHSEEIFLDVSLLQAGDVDPCKMIRMTFTKPLILNLPYVPRTLSEVQILSLPEDLSM